MEQSNSDPKVLDMVLPPLLDCEREWKLNSICHRLCLRPELKGEYGDTPNERMANICLRQGGVLLQQQKKTQYNETRDRRDVLDELWDIAVACGQLSLYMTILLLVKDK